MKRMPSATTQAATAATMRAVKRPSSRRAHGAIQAPAVQQAATVANRDDTLATSPILSAQPSSEQKASSPQPANTENPQSAARRRLATVGIIGEIRMAIEIPAAAGRQSIVKSF